MVPAILSVISTILDQEMTRGKKFCSDRKSCMPGVENGRRGGVGLLPRAAHASPTPVRLYSDTPPAPRVSMIAAEAEDLHIGHGEIDEDGLGRLGDGDVA